MVRAAESTPPSGTRTSHQSRRQKPCSQMPFSPAQRAGRGSSQTNLPSGAVTSPFSDVAVGVGHAGDVHVARVRVAGQRHRLVLKEHFQARVGLVGAGAVDALKIGDAEGLEVGLPDLVSCRSVEADRARRDR